MNKAKKLWLAMSSFLLLIAIASGIFLAREYSIRTKAENQIQSIQEELDRETDAKIEEAAAELAQTESEPEQEPVLWGELTRDEKASIYEQELGIEFDRLALDFEELKTETNPDIYAWIKVPGSGVDYPVVQHPSDDNYYLDYNLDGSKGYPGCIYTESCNSKDWTDRMTVIYGHNMKNGSAFGTLLDYERKDYFDSNRYILIYTPDDVLVYEVFAAYATSSNHIIYGHEWDDESWGQYLNDTLLMDGDMDNHLEKYVFTPETKVLTLSTCMRNSPNQRYIIQGALIDGLQEEIP